MKNRTGPATIVNCIQFQHDLSSTSLVNLQDDPIPWIINFLGWSKDCLNGFTVAASSDRQLWWPRSVAPNPSWLTGLAISFCGHLLVGWLAITVGHVLQQPYLPLWLQALLRMHLMYNTYNDTNTSTNSYGGKKHCIGKGIQEPPEVIKKYHLPIYLWVMDDMFVC